MEEAKADQDDAGKLKREIHAEASRGQMRVHATCSLTASGRNMISHIISLSIILQEIGLQTAPAETGELV